uniref:SJCHGC01285 protein n=1 Tax=Schistosoma japonicum TaxID=6182 RepID=Q5DDH5_SCHJA|nr:SJCHGC01285 protein [Schistosoma japonicum]
MSDNIWEESSVKGFQFDLDETDDVSTYSKSLGDSFGGTFGDESITIEFNSQFCTICHNLVANEIYYENDATFCSESCWLKAITIALDDFVVGGMSTWPLSTFVSQASKSIILNLAASTYDGDLITKIVNKFKSSLSESTFQSILLKNPVAAFHFLNFLRQTGQLIRLKKYMKLLGFIRESEIPSYNQLMQKLMNLSSGHVDEVNKYLMQIAESEVASNPTVKFIFEISSELAVILDYQNSYEREWSLHYNELHTNANTQKLAATLPKSLLMQPLCETLSALVRMDHSLKSNSRAEVLGKKCKIADEQFKWLVVEPLVQSQNWDDLESLVLKKRSLSRRMEITIPSDRLILHFNSLGVPNNIIEGYLKYMSDDEEFIQIIIRLNMIDEAVKLCLEKRNINTLKDLMSQIPSNHPQREKISHYLSVPVAQWKDFVCRQAF